MKKILLSLKPNWLKEILYNNKILEIRKSCPNINNKYKILLYCTKNGDKLIVNDKQANGFIIGEIDYIKNYNIKIINNKLYINNEEKKWDKFLETSKLNKENIYDYLKDGNGYGWYIKNPIIYDNFLTVEEILGYDYDKKKLISWCYV